MPATMEEVIKIVLVEEQSYNSASATDWPELLTKKMDAIPMELTIQALAAIDAVSVAI